MLAACAIGMLHADQLLTKLVLKELQHFADDQEHMMDIANLNAFAYTLAVCIYIITLYFLLLNF